MTDQQMFNRVWEHFVTNNQPLSFSNGPDEGVQCLYRGPNGACCAAGLFIPDEQYDKKMELKSLSMVAMDFPDAFPKGLNLDLLDRMQEAHDEAADSDGSIRTQLENLAESYSLEVSQS